MPSCSVNRFEQALRKHGRGELAAERLDTLQVNVGRLCNQVCRHCHVDAGPHQTGADVNMGPEVAAIVERVVRSGAVRVLDLTGGAPELNPSFRRLVEAARDAGVHVMDRCNLSVLLQPGQEDLAAFLADRRVEVVASLPFYRRDRTDRQRGAGVFDQSLLGLRRLNELGYGSRDDLRLNLVYNPTGAFLPGDQHALEREFRRELTDGLGIAFHQLFCITNMPIARFAEWLHRSGNYESYMAVLANAFNPAALEGLMCRNLISVAPDGTLHDCDFNQMLGLPVSAHVPRHIREFDSAVLARRPVVTDSHCLGCTAGAGSSCGGAVT
ncbi:MAG: arsenosugar biosynthesis radical SAM protein ArsS [Planctomycetes bacterium]|nr:arsenosugar biosynthesis radical SAM protein ArsS [Planctomycetota bacterium]MCB9888569.1 arsenosugar biosynthesis radical SAM protein ArsS [Planctomycetota bacterium]